MNEKLEIVAISFLISRKRSFSLCFAVYLEVWIAFPDGDKVTQQASRSKMTKRWDIERLE